MKGKAISPMHRSTSIGLAIIACLGLVACDGESTASSGVSPQALPPPPVTQTPTTPTTPSTPGTPSSPTTPTTPASPANAAPTISGTPVREVAVGSAYDFVPVASDADGNMLGFSIQNRPAWASFDTTTGRLSGTPPSGSAGTFSGITISVSDGRASAALPAFAIVVRAAMTTNGSATLSWQPPTLNTDDSALTNLAGYRIYAGTSPDSLTSLTQIANPGLTSYVVTNLVSGIHYFAVTAYSSSGSESPRSNIGSKLIP